MVGPVHDSESSKSNATDSGQAEEKKIWTILETVADPEVPVLSVLDLGIVRNVVVDTSDEGITEVIVTITPTYSGCPAMDMISMNIRLALIEKGYENIKIKSVLSPAWTTAWMTEEGKQKLKEYGIAPPHYNGSTDPLVECPQCHSKNTLLLSQFGSTACKALYQCQDCREPFDYFKCH